MTKRTKLPPTIRDKCGTYAGWNAHQQAGEYQCQPCNDANRAYRKAYRRRTGETRATLYTDAEIHAIRSEVSVKIQELIHEAENRHGALYCHVTTYELRHALGMDVDDWPPLRQLEHTTNHEAVPTGAASVIPTTEQDAK